MVESADDSMGQLMKALDDSGLASNTIVIFFSDNGGVRYQAKQPRPITDNRPLRAGKGHVFEGGIREPLMIKWPGITRGGAVVDHEVISTDFLSTICECTGTPIREAGDGRSLFPLLRGHKQGTRPLFWHYPHYSDQGGRPAAAVREQEWKLIRFYEDDRLELYNLQNDPGERRNLIRLEGARARRLNETLTDWLHAVDAAMPTPNPAYDPKTASEGLTGYEPPTPPV
jgi:arylsulfatase A-like enzyme